jgi:hypothetical protein
MAVTITYAAPYQTERVPLGATGTNAVAVTIPARFRRISVTFADSSANAAGGYIAYTGTDGAGLSASLAVPVWVGSSYTIPPIAGKSQSSEATITVYVAGSNSGYAYFSFGERAEDGT